VGATESGVFALARQAGVEVESGKAFPWLSNRGHLNPVLADVVPGSTLGVLRSIYDQLGGDEGALATKRAGSDPKPDLLLPSAGLIVEVDEIQHFTNDRLRTLEHYPADVQLAFDLDEYRSLIDQWSARADKYRAAKPTVDFPHPGGRRAQRAYFDAARDLLAPYGWTVLRVPAPECDATLAAAGLRDRLGQLLRA
jgi:hypothetical protein